MGCDYVMVNLAKSSFVKLIASNIYNIATVLLVHYYTAASQNVSIKEIEMRIVQLVVEGDPDIGQVPPCRQTIACSHVILSAFIYVLVFFYMFSRDIIAWRSSKQILPGKLQHV